MNKIKTLNSMKKQVKQATSIEELFKIKNLRNLWFLVNNKLVNYQNFNPNIMEHKYNLYSQDGKVYRSTSYVGTHGSHFSSNPSYVSLKTAKENILHSDNIFTESYVDKLGWVSRNNYMIMKP